MKDGIININKPQEMTSFDVVAILRKKLGIKRIGHLGTLDPMAEGVLPVALGKATRVMDYLDADMKEYVAEIVFGASTDTDDIWGKLISQDKDLNLTKESVEEAVKSFIGVGEQIPPKYSALKVEGRKLYDYARAGQNVEIKSRKVYIPSISMLEFGKRKVEQLDDEMPFVVMRVLCSKGTYVRAIARDIGEKLGTCATMSGLLRTRSGSFAIEDAIRLCDIIDMEETEITRSILGTDTALRGFPMAQLGEWEEYLFKNGVKLEAEQWCIVGDAEASDDRDGWLQGDMEAGEWIKSFPLELPNSYSKTYRMYGNKGFIGLGILQEDGGIKAEKVLV